MRFIKNNLYILLTCVLAVCFAVLSAISLGNISSPSTYYQTGELENTSAFNSVCFKVNMDDDVDLDSVWINIGSIDYKKEQGDAINIYTSIARNTVLSFSTLSGRLIGVSNSYDSVKVGSWRLACVNQTYANYPELYLLFSTLNTIKINEVAFVGKTADGGKVLLSADPVGAGAKVKYSGADSALESSGEFPMNDSAKALASKLIDEQNKFDISKIDGETYTADVKLSGGELSTLESIRNLTSGRGYHIDAYANPLGYAFIALGTTVFGANAFGLRIMPFLFTVAAMFLIYFICLLITGKSLFGFIGAFLFATGGYSLFFANTGRVDAILLFFILLALYALLKFIKRGISSAHAKKGYFNLILGGASMAVAVAVKTTAIFYVLPLLAMLVFGIVKQYRYATDKGSVNTAEFKRKFTLTLTYGISAYAILPFILLLFLYLAFYSSYSAFYGAQGVFLYGTKAFFGIFNQTLYSVGENGSAIGYIINYSAHSETPIKFAFGNLATAIIGFFAIIFCAFLFLLNVKSSGNPLTSKNPSFRTYIALVALAVFGWILALTLTCTAAEFYIPSVFISLIIVLGVRELFNAVKPTWKGMFITVRCSAVVISVAILAFFALAVPAFIGLEASSGLYAWQVLGGLTA